MSAVFVESRAYRSVVHLLTLYCLFKIALTIWSFFPFHRYQFDFISMDWGLFITSLAVSFSGPLTAVCLLLVGLSRSRAGHVGRCALTGVWLLLRFSALPGVLRNFSHKPHYIILTFIDLTCLALFLIALLRLGGPRTAGEGADPPR